MRNLLLEDQIGDGPDRWCCYGQVNNPPCDWCGCAATKASGMVKSNAEEKADGAGRVESFGCPSCGLTTRSVCALIHDMDQERTRGPFVSSPGAACTLSPKHEQLDINIKLTSAACCQICPKSVLGISPFTAGILE